MSTRWEIHVFDSRFNRWSWSHATTPADTLAALRAAQDFAFITEIEVREITTRVLTIHQLGALKRQAKPAA